MNNNDNQENNASSQSKRIRRSTKSFGKRGLKSAKELVLDSVNSAETSTKKFLAGKEKVKKTKKVSAKIDIATALGELEMLERSIVAKRKDDNATATEIGKDTTSGKLEDFSSAQTSLGVLSEEAKEGKKVEKGENIKKITFQFSSEDLWDRLSAGSTVLLNGLSGFESEKIYNLPVLALRDAVFFPGKVVPIFVGRQQSIAAVEKAMNGNRRLFLSMEKTSTYGEIAEDNLSGIGVLAIVLQKIKLPNGALKLLVDANCRGEVEEFTSRTPCVEAIVKPITSNYTNCAEIEALKRILLDQFEVYISAKKISPEAIEKIIMIEDAGSLADGIVVEMIIPVDKKQEVLSCIDVQERCEKVLYLLVSEMQILQAEKALQDRVKSQVEKNQKDYYLNEQMKAIRKELGDSDDIHEAIERYENILRSKDFPERVVEKLREDIKRLKVTNSMSSEAIRAYVEFVMSLPWGKLASTSEVKIANAIRVLNKSHYGLDKVKSAVLEYIAVQSKKTKPSGGVLCLHGAPGVGKTKMVKSIAEAIGRPYEKISLGGVRDEAEIRGHRKTYVAAMAGKIIQAIKRSGVDNPVILLDEIDKLASDHKGDPAAAMLEVLDPEQNSSFQDHYVDLEYDLSKVLFIATANNIYSTQRALVDRLELLHVPSYLERERVEICRNYIIPRILEENCVPEGRLQIDDGAISLVIKGYTKESGVRELGRVMTKIARKSLVRLMTLDGSMFTTKKEEIIANLQNDLFDTLSDGDASKDKEQDIDVVNGALARLDIGDVEMVFSLQLVKNLLGEEKCSEVIAASASVTSAEYEILLRKIITANDDMLKDQVITRKEVEKSLEKIKQIPIDESGVIKVTAENLHLFLGVCIYPDEEKERKDTIGVTNGLAYTEVDGELLMVEATSVPCGKGEVKITGKLGDVMKESVQVCSSYVKSRAESLDLLESALLKTEDIHIHFPAGATPKDGPSAGVAICTTLVSLMKKIPVRSDVAMTGEVSLRGRVLPIGGLREKLVAALRYGIKTVLIPEGNKNDLCEIPDYIKDEIEIIICSTVDEVLKLALSKSPFGNAYVGVNVSICNEMSESAVVPLQPLRQETPITH